MVRLRFHPTIQLSTGVAATPFGSRLRQEIGHWHDMTPPGSTDRLNWVEVRGYGFDIYCDYSEDGYARAYVAHCPDLTPANYVFTVLDYGVISAPVMCDDAIFYRLINNEGWQ